MPQILLIAWSKIFIYPAPTPPAALGGDRKIEGLADPGGSRHLCQDGRRLSPGLAQVGSVGQGGACQNFHTGFFGVDTSEKKVCQRSAGCGGSHGAVAENSDLQHRLVAHGARRLPEEPVRQGDREPVEEATRLQFMWIQVSSSVVRFTVLSCLGRGLEALGTIRFTV